MPILISNDDGVYADGIRILAESLREIASVSIVAPDRNRSGASNSLTIDRPLRIQRLPNNTVSVQGTPTDCVHFALTGFLDKQPDMVVSGINEAANLGDDTLYSGTVAAAMEGRNLGIPAIAVSMATEKPVVHYQTAAAITKQLVLRNLANPLPPRAILNVNVPDLALAECGPWQTTRLGRRHKAEPMIKDTDPKGKPIYWIGPAGGEDDARPGTDFDTVKNQCVSVTPLHVDLTHYQALDKLSSWLAA